MDVGAARRGQASACSTNTQIIHEDDQRQRYLPATSHSRAPNDPLWWCRLRNMLVRKQRDATRYTPIHSMRRIYGGKQPSSLTAPTSEVPSLAREANVKLFRAFRHCKSRHRVRSEEYHHPSGPGINTPDPASDDF